MVSNTKLMARLEDVTACQAGGCKNASYGEAAGVVAIRTFPAKYVSTDLSHVDIFCVEGFGKDAIV